VSASSCARRTIAALLVVGCAAILGGCFNSNQSPIAAFSTTIDGLTVMFNAGPSHDPDGSIATYHWEFGDGGWANTATATHTYETSAARSYTVSLTVTDNDGAADITSSSVQVTPPAAPVAPVNPTPTPPDDPQPSPPSPGTDYSVTAGGILSEFEQNEIAATLKYQGTTIAVSGYVNNMGISSFSELPYVTLISSPGAFTLEEVWCYFPRSAASGLTHLREDDRITIVGRFDEYMLLTVWLEDCSLQ